MKNHAQRVVCIVSTSCALLQPFRFICNIKQTHANPQANTLVFWGFSIARNQRQNKLKQFHTSISKQFKHVEAFYSHSYMLTTFLATSYTLNKTLHDLQKSTLQLINLLQLAHKATVGSTTIFYTVIQVETKRIATPNCTLKLFKANCNTLLVSLIKFCLQIKSSCKRSSVFRSTIKLIKASTQYQFHANIYQTTAKRFCFDNFKIKQL